MLCLSISISTLRLVSCLWTSSFTAAGISFLISSAAPSATASAYSQNYWMCIPWYGFSLLMAALICMPCLIAEARALFMFIFISPLIIPKYIAIEKIFTDQLPHNLRCRQIMVFRILHQSFFVFSRKTNGECCDFIHTFHSFHNSMKKSVRQVNTVVQENMSFIEYYPSTIIPTSATIVPR